jgi:hypothetical protein
MVEESGESIISIATKGMSIERMRQPDFARRATDRRADFRSSVRARVLNTLEEGLLKAGEKGRKVYNRLSSEIHGDPDKSLFREMQTGIKFFMTGQSSDTNREIATSLIVARRSLVREAGAAGVLKKAQERVQEALQISDFEKALEAVKRIDITAFEEDATQGPELSSPDFGGVNEGYVRGIQYQMEYGYLRAQAEMARKAGNAPKADSLDRAAGLLRRRIDYEVWETQDFEGRALEYLEAQKEKREQEEEKKRLRVEREGREGGVGDLLRSIQEGQENMSEAMGRQAETAELSLELQRQSIELMRRGYKSFIQGERVRAHVNPERFDQELPPWFEELGDIEQGILRTRLWINYMASVKRDFGMIDLDKVVGMTGLRYERKDLANMWERMPGFRVAMATMMHDIFKRGEDHFVISGTPRKVEEDGTVIEATGGYGIMGDVKDFEAYKEGLIRKIENYFGRDPTRRRELENRYKVSAGLLATAAVSSVDNLLFATGAYDSADEIRKISLGASNMYSEQIRAFYQPGRRGKEKWSFPRGSAFAPGATELIWGGPLGQWMSENVVNNRNGFGDRVRDEQIGYMPFRLFYSLMDHTYFGSDRDTNLSSALVNQGKRRVDQDLYDYRRGRQAVDWSDLLPDEFYGAYADLQSSAVKIYKHLASRKTDDRMDTPTLVDALAKVRKDATCVKHGVFLNEDFMVAAIGLVASPGGFVLGIPEILLDLPNQSYDMRVHIALSDERIFEGMPSGFKSRLYGRLHAKDLDSWRGYISSIFGADSFVGDRGKLRKQAEENIRKIKERRT